MSEQPGTPSPLTLTADPRLDALLQRGWDEFGPAFAAAGPAKGARWLARRAGDPELADSVEPLLDGLAPGASDDERIESLFALAEVAEEMEDDLLTDALWEGALAAARELGDPDAVLEATSHLADLAERLGDPLAAAEFFVAFLNWRREPGHASDPEAVEEAFDQVVRLAELDGAPKAAAEWTYRQARYTRLLDTEDERAVEGDWEGDPAPYAAWA